MGFSVELRYSGNRRVLPSAIVFILLLTILSMTSCNTELLPVISDPYIEVLNGGNWGPADRLFRLTLRLRGYRTIPIITDRDNPLSSVISSFEPPPRIAVISPLNAASIRTITHRPERMIIAGGFAVDDGPGIENVVPDRRESMTLMGKLAADIVSENEPAGGVYALFDANTEMRRAELESFLNSFRTSSQGRSEIKYRDLAETGDEGLPEDFDRILKDSALLVLFAGSLNISALGASDESGLPVITESLRGSKIWAHRIVASIEDDERAMKRILIEQLTDSDPEAINYYSSQIIKGKRYP